MLKIPGIDPLIMQRIKERTSKQVIYDAEKTKITEDRYRDEKEQQQQYDQQELAELLERLNRLMEEEGFPVRFRLVNDEGKPGVQVVDADREKVLAVVPPRRVWQLIRQTGEAAGFIVDISI